VELRLEANDRARYEVALIDAGTNRVLWRSGRLLPAARGDRPSVSVAIPTAVLGAQHYVVTLFGADQNGGTEALSGYAFEVVPR
jgi:hypothetical protein